MTRRALNSVRGNVPSETSSHDRKAREVLEALERIGRDTGLLPLPAVERALFPCVAYLSRELGEDQLVARCRIGAFDLRQPVLLVRRGTIARIVHRRPDGQIDSAPALERAEVEPRHGSPRSRAATSSRMRATMLSGGDMSTRIGR